jgi:hypothetical protein
MSNKNYAIIKDNVAINVIVFDNPTQEILEFFKNEYSADDILQVDDFISTGSTYDGFTFFPPQPFLSWIKNEDLKVWEAPVSYPDFDPENPKHYKWNEDILNWEEIQASE